MTDVKWLNNRRYASLDGSVAVFPRPLLHPESPHRVRIAAQERYEAHATIEGIDTWFVGCTTYSGDVLGRGTFSVGLAVGDLVVFDDAGAYSESMSTRFLGRPEPNVVCVE